MNSSFIINLITISILNIAGYPLLLYLYEMVIGYDNTPNIIIWKYIHYQEYNRQP
jgi:hypothetical protein